jgi:hypothetical protein
VFLRTYAAMAAIPYHLFVVGVELNWRKHPTNFPRYFHAWLPGSLA